MNPWLLACRPKTLPAAIVPVLVGTALAIQAEIFHFVPAFVCILFALLIQIGTNFANDYFDYVKGVDTQERIGPTRAVAAGLIDPPVMLVATCLILFIAFCLGLILVFYGGPWLILVGIASVVCAVAYTGGPYPLGYHGLGDVFVILFFGIIAVMFTYYVQAVAFTFASFLCGVGCGLVINNILVINNYRDLKTDRASGKKTTIVFFGRKFGRIQFFASYAIATVLIPLILLTVGFGWGILLPVLLCPLWWKLCQRLIHAQNGNAYNQLLAQVAKTVIAYGVLLTIGILLA